MKIPQSAFPIPQSSCSKTPWAALKAGAMELYLIRPNGLFSAQGVVLNAEFRIIG